MGKPFRSARGKSLSGSVNVSVLGRRRGPKIKWRRVSRVICEGAQCATA